MKFELIHIINKRSVANWPIENPESWFPTNLLTHPYLLTHIFIQGVNELLAVSLVD